MVPNLNIAKEDRENIDEPCNREYSISNAYLKDSKIDIANFSRHEFIIYDSDIIYQWKNVQKK